MLQTTAILMDRRTTGAAHELTLAAPELARGLGPGQAVLVKAGWGPALTLRRTFYPIGLAAETWTLRVPPGGDWGHAWLRAAALGSEIDCLGPVGQGFGLPPAAHNLLCLGEGELAWALLPAAAAADGQGMAVTFAVEGVTGRSLAPASRLPPGVEYVAATLDGSLGRPGTLAPLLAELLPWADAAFLAGSLTFYGRMTAAIQAARFRLNRGFGQALYPATFLCGTGACQACAADVAGGRRRVCLRGPVFDLTDITGRTD